MGWRPRILLGPIVLLWASPAFSLHVVSSTSLLVPAVTEAYPYRILIASGGAVSVVGGNGSGPLVVNVSSHGVRVSSNAFGRSDRWWSGAALDASGNLLVIGQGNSSASAPSFDLAKFSTGAALLGSAEMPLSSAPAGGQSPIASAMLSHSNGDFYGAGFVSASTSPNAATAAALQCWIGRWNSALVLVSSVTFPAATGPVSCWAQDIKADANGDLIVVGGIGVETRTSSFLSRWTGGLVMVASRTFDADGRADKEEAIDRVAVSSSGILWAAGRSTATSLLGPTCSTSGGDLWVARFGAGFEALGRYATTRSSVSLERPVEIVLDGEGMAWVPTFEACNATNPGRVLLFDPQGGLLASSDFPVSEVLPLSMAEAPDGVLWVSGRAYKAEGSWPVVRLGLSPRRIATLTGTPSTSAVSWSWSVPVRFDADFYRLRRISGDAVVSTSAARQFIDGGYGGNTPVFLRVSAVNASGEGPLTAGTTVYTLAAAPQSPVVSSISAVGFSVSWATAGNSASTVYSLHLSTGDSPATNGFSGNVVSSVSAAAADFSNLRPATTYFLALKATNADGVDTVLVAAGPARTLSLESPVPSGAALGASSIAWSWADVAGEEGYRVIDGSGASLSGDLPSGTTRWVEVGLSTNAAYGRRVAAFSGAESSTSAARTVFTNAAPPGALSVDAVSASSFSVAWSSNTNPAATVYRLNVWEAVAGSTTLTTTASSAAVAGLVGGATYFVSLEALNGDSVATPGPPAVSTATLPGGSAAAGSLISVQLPSGRATVDVPSGAFEPGVVVSVETPGALPAAGGFVGTGVGVRITASGAAQPRQRVAIGLPYRDADVAGVEVSRLLVARFDEGRGVWVPLDSTVDAAGRRVTGTTDHFSLFQVMAAPRASGLDAPRAFPNPLRPSLGHTGVTLDRLPAGTRVRVYTLVGELVRELTASGAGVAFWDGKNAAGSAVASGVYAVYLQGEGQKRTIKVAVQR